MNEAGLAKKKRGKMIISIFYCIAVIAERIYRMTGILLFYDIAYRIDEKYELGLFGVNKFTDEEVKVFEEMLDEFDSAMCLSKHSGYLKR